MRRRHSHQQSTSYGTNRHTNELSKVTEGSNPGSSGAHGPDFVQSSTPTGSTV